MIWLGESRGYLTDWVTQQWVRFTGRRVSFANDPWLLGPVGKPRGIGVTYFEDLASETGLTVRRDSSPRGLVPAFDALRGPTFDPARVHGAVAAFYERTSGYEIDAWAEWCGAFRPFGRALAVLFARRLQQLNVPLSALDTSRGMTSEVLQLVDPTSGSVRHTAWGRRLLGSGNVLYAGSYSICRVPGFDGPCVRVVFPLPNGNAMVVMRPVAHEDGSFSVVSAGDRFGEPGFYFTVRYPGGGASARYVRALRESIRVYPGEDGGVRADHTLTLWGATLLRLHYRLRVRQTATAMQPH